MRKVRPFVLTFFLLLSADTALGCVCETPDVPEALRRANAVFAGEVVSIVNKRALFKVEQYWKGISSPEVSLVMGGSVLRRTKKNREVAVHTSCDVEFEKGEKYLVYAGDRGGYLRAWTCSRTQRLAYAEDDLKKLGAGQIPKVKSRRGDGETNVIWFYEGSPVHRELVGGLEPGRWIVTYYDAGNRKLGARIIDLSAGEIQTGDR